MLSTSSPTRPSTAACSACRRFLGGRRPHGPAHSTVRATLPCRASCVQAAYKTGALATPTGEHIPNGPPPTRRAVLLVEVCMGALGRPHRSGFCTAEQPGTHGGMGRCARAARSPAGALWRAEADGRCRGIRWDGAGLSRSCWGWGGGAFRLRGQACEVTTPGPGRMGPMPIRRATCREAHDVHVTTGGARRDAIKNCAARPILTPNHVVQKTGRQVYRTSRSLDCGSKILYFNIFVDFKFERCVECILIYQL